MRMLYLMFTSHKGPVLKPEREEGWGDIAVGPVLVLDGDMNMEEKQACFAPKYQGQTEYEKNVLSEP